jgi:hypothetical protein
VFSLEPRCQAAWGSQKEDLDPGGDLQVIPVAHLGALVPGQRGSSTWAATSTRRSEPMGTLQPYGMRRAVADGIVI